MGVAGGATRAAMTQHQARRDNMADVAAKDGSQVRCNIFRRSYYDKANNQYLQDSVAIKIIPMSYQS